MIDMVQGYTTISKPYRKIGINIRELISGKYRDRMAPEDRKNYDAQWERVQKGYEEELFSEYRIMSDNDDYHWIRTHIVVIERDPDSGDIRLCVGHDRDITVRKRSEVILKDEVVELRQKLKVSEYMRQIGASINTSSELNESLLEAFTHLRNMTNFDLGEVFELTEDSLTRRFTYPASSQTDWDANPLKKTVKTSHYPIILDGFKGMSEYKSLMIIPIRNEHDTIGAVTLWGRDANAFGGYASFPAAAFADIISSLLINHRIFSETVRDLERDDLTGFMTRKSFFRTIQSCWKDLAGDSDSSIAMLDLDLFKGINDNYGHKVGDRVIRDFAAICRSVLRSDVQIGRYGGEEFIAILPGCPKDLAYRILERVRRSCENGLYSGDDRRVTVSIGIAECKNPSQIDDSIQKADTALYEAKRRGRNRTVIAK